MMLWRGRKWTKRYISIHKIVVNNTHLVTDLASLECSFSLAPAPAKAELC
jgi:hypothetical protein